MNQRTVSWGTVLAGGLALGLALVVGLTQVGGVSIPFSSAGPGVIVLVGVLILLAGLFAVIRSSRAGRAAGHTTPAGPADQAASPHAAPTATPSTLPPASETVPGPLEVPAPADSEPADANARQSSH